jgi:hypothetical protein
LAPLKISQVVKNIISNPEVQKEK